MFESTVVCGRIALGIQGEHNARKVPFYDAQIWKEIFGEGRFELLHQRNGDEAPYPVVLTIEDGVPCWYVASSDTAIAGSGKCELRYMVDDKLIKSCTYATDVIASLGDDTTEAPEPEKAWVDQVLEAGDAAKQAVELSEKAIEAAESAEQSAKDAEAFASEGNGHIADESNPHNVTASQVGAYSKHETDKAIETESKAVVGRVEEIMNEFASVLNESFYYKHEIDNMFGDIDTALDAILTIQESIVGGAE